MKYAHYDATTEKLLGWYDDDIHQTIPTPNFQVSESDWQSAIDQNANAVDPVGKTLFVKDFRTVEDRKLDKIQKVKALAQQKINTLAPEWKQRNATARALELVNIIATGGTLTTDEQAEKDTIDALWVQVKAIRAYSNTLETSVNADVNADISIGWP